MLYQHKEIFQSQISKLKKRFDFLFDNIDILSDGDICCIFDNTENDIKWLRKNILIKEWMRDELIQLTTADT